MGISVKKSFNELNIMIREENSKNIFKLKDEKIDEIGFFINTQSFNIDKEYSVGLKFFYSKNESPEVSDIEIKQISNYFLDKDGFRYQDDNLEKKSGNERIRKNMGGFINKINSELHINMNGIKLQKGIYELVVSVDNLIACLYPFTVE